MEGCNRPPKAAKKSLLLITDSHRDLSTKNISSDRSSPGRYSEKSAKRIILSMWNAELLNTRLDFRPLPRLSDRPHHRPKSRVLPVSVRATMAFICVKRSRRTTLTNTYPETMLETPLLNGSCEFSIISDFFFDQKIRKFRKQKISATTRAIF